WAPCTPLPPALPLPVSAGGAAQVRLLDDGFRCRLNTRYFTLFAEEHVRHLRGNIVLPMVAFVDCFIQPFPLFFTFKTANPDIQVVFFLPDKTSEDDHAFRDLERNDFLLHEFHPFFTLSGFRAILP